MLILIDGRPLQERGLNAEKAHIIIKCLDLLMEDGGGLDWVLLLDGSLSDVGSSSPAGREMETALLKLSARKRMEKSWFRGAAARKWWYGWRIPAILRRKETALFMATGGSPARRTLIPQCLWASGVIAGKASGGRRSESVRNALPKNPGGSPAARVLFAYSERERQGLTGRGAPEDIFVIYGGPSEDYFPLPWTEKEGVKVRYSAGKEYFLVISTDLGSETLIGILKAFSLFKKRQQSNMQLVFTGSGAAGREKGGDRATGSGVTDAGFLEKLESYKYRGDVHIHTGVRASEEVRLVAASYAVIPYFSESATGLRVLNAFRAGVPVITVPGGCQAEAAGEAALYAESGDPGSLADRLKEVYKDENLRNGLIAKGQTRLAEFSWSESAARVREGISRLLPN